MRQAVLHGCVVASYTVESFSVDRIRELCWETVEARVRELRSIMSIDDLPADRGVL